MHLDLLVVHRRRSATTEAASELGTTIFSTVDWFGSGLLGRLLAARRSSGSRRFGGRCRSSFGLQGGRYDLGRQVQDVTQVLHAGVRQVPVVVAPADHLLHVLSRAQRLHGLNHVQVLDSCSCGNGSVIRSDVWRRRMKAIVVSDDRRRLEVMIVKVRVGENCVWWKLVQFGRVDGERKNKISCYELNSNAILNENFVSKDTHAKPYAWLRTGL